MSNTCPIALPGVEPIRQIGAGGFGEVWLANQTNFDRQVALKIARRPFTSANDSRRFERECKALGRLTGHPNIIGVHMSGFENDLPYILMEYVDGGTLADHGQSLSEPELRAIAAQLCSAVSAAHDLGVLHRDLKPENVFLRADRSAVLGDFGIARLGDGNNTEAGQVTATIAFAAPEILNGAPATPSADVYGIGVTIAAAVLGRSPFRPDDAMGMEAIMARVFEGTPPDLTAFGMSPAFSGLIQMAMARNPEHRPQSADDLLARLNGLPSIPGAGEQYTNQQWIQPDVQHQQSAYGAAPVVGQVPPETTTSSGNTKLVPALLAGLGLVVVAALGIWAFTNGSGDSGTENETVEAGDGDTSEPDNIDDQTESESTLRSSETSEPENTESSDPAPSQTTTSGAQTTVPTTAAAPPAPLVIPLSTTEVSDLTDIPIDQNGWDEISGPANSPQYCDVRPDITGLVDTTAALYPLDPTVGLVFQQVVFRMHRFATPENAANFMQSYTTLTCESWESTEYTSDGNITRLSVSQSEPVNVYGDETRQVDQEALLPNGFNLLSRTLLVRSGTDVMKLVFQTDDPAEIDQLTDGLARRAAESLGYDE